MNSVTITFHTTTYDPEQCHDGDYGPDKETDKDIYVVEPEGGETIARAIYDEMIGRRYCYQPSDWPMPDDLRRVWFSAKPYSDPHTSVCEEVSAHIDGAHPNTLRALARLIRDDAT